MNVQEPALETESPTTAAAAEIDQLLATLGITRVISVDDAWDPEDGGPDAVAEAVTGGGEPFGKVVRELEQQDPEFARNALASDQDVVADYVREHWEDFTPELRTALAAVGSDFQHADHPKDSGALAELKRQFGGAVTLTCIGPKAWPAEFESVATATEGVLVLFDMDMSNGGGSEESGKQLLTDLLQRDNPLVRAGLLSFRLDNELDETELTAELETASAVEAGAVVAIGKYRLTDGLEASFPSVMRVLVAGKEIERYRGFARTLIDQSAAAARKALDDLQRYSIVGAFSAAIGEGVFELDAPLRVAQRAFERTLVTEARSHLNAAGTLTDVRSIDLENYMKLTALNEQFSKILHEDHFHAGPSINESQLALEVGDVFEVSSIYPRKGGGTPAKHIYILLAQACDISIRLSGKREPAVKTLVLHRMRPRSPGQSASVRLKAVGRFDPDRSDEWFIDLADRIFVPVAAVDAVVFNADGRSRIDTTGVAPGTLPRSWIARHGRLKEEVLKLLVKYANASKSLEKVAGKDELLRTIGASLVGAGGDSTPGLSFRMTESVLEYGLRRVARVHGPRAAGLVSLIASHESRPAFDNPLVKEPVQQSAWRGSTGGH